MIRRISLKMKEKASTMMMKVKQKMGSTQISQKNAMAVL